MKSQTVLIIGWEIFPDDFQEEDNDGDVSFKYRYGELK